MSTYCSVLQSVAVCMHRDHMQTAYSKHTYIHSYIRWCMLRSGAFWYGTDMFQTQTNMNKPPTLWEGGRGACRVPGNMLQTGGKDTHTHKHARTQTHTRTRARIKTHGTHARTRTHARTHTHAHTRADTHMDTRGGKRPPPRA